MVTRVRQVLLLLPLTLAAFAGQPRQFEHDSLPRSALYVMRDGAWRLWWSSDSAPAHYDEHNATLAPLVSWRRVSNGVEVGSLRISGSGEAWRLRLVIARIDPARVTLSAVPAGGIGQRSWTLDSMSADAELAVSGGQFRSAHVPWGWVVVNGVESQPPELAPLGMAVTVDSLGKLALLSRDEMLAARARAGGAHVRIAFQSYPVALLDGDVPAALQSSGRGVDLSHRDGRLGVCTLATGDVLLVLTRFDALNGGAAEAPFGTTVPEMAAVLGALGCRRALLLDGGISRQLGVRDGDSLIVRHRGWRSIPMGLEARAR
jgi:Phosphodiester glycosidase